MQHSFIYNIMQQIFHIFIVAKNEPKGFRYNGSMPKMKNK